MCKEGHRSSIPSAAPLGCLVQVTEQKLKEQKIRRTSKEILLAAAGDAAPAAAGDAAPAAASLGAGPPEACKS